jgi:hypothetical protein
MTSKKLLVSAGLLLATTSASLAQGLYGYSDQAPYGYAQGYYDYAPGYYGYGGYYPQYGYEGGGYYNRDDNRGGYGPRVGPGSGMGIGSQR